MTYRVINPFLPTRALFFLNFLAFKLPHHSTPTAKSLTTLKNQHFLYFFQQITSNTSTRKQIQQFQSIMDVSVPFNDDLIQSIGFQGESDEKSSDDFDGFLSDGADDFSLNSIDSHDVEDILGQGRESRGEEDSFLNLFEGVEGKP